MKSHSCLQTMVELVVLFLLLENLIMFQIFLSYSTLPPFESVFFSKILEELFILKFSTINLQGNHPLLGDYRLNNPFFNVTKQFLLTLSLVHEQLKILRRKSSS